ncbi:MAG: MnmC family methyltransferase, partial [Vampirovibrionales bacterium]|nr:MnmC family methyltransferase [Vampirovibrionales bacterium]
FLALLQHLFPKTSLNVTVYALDSQFPKCADFHRILKQPIWETLGAILQKNLPEEPICLIESTNLVDSYKPECLSLISNAIEHNTYYQTLEFSKDPIKTTSIEDGRLTLTINWIEGDLRQTLPHLAQGIPKKIDVIFYDGFSPSVQPEIWTLERMQTCKELLKPMGIWASYCSASALRGALMQADFFLYETRPLGLKRRGGTIASRSQLPNSQHSQALWKLLKPMAELDLLKLRARAGVPYRDAGSREAIIHHRHQEQSRMAPYAPKAASAADNVLA